MCWGNNPELSDNGKTELQATAIRYRFSRQKPALKCASGVQSHGSVAPNTLDVNPWLVAEVNPWLVATLNLSNFLLGFTCGNWSVRVVCTRPSSGEQGQTFCGQTTLLLIANFYIFRLSDSKIVNNI